MSERYSNNTDGLRIAVVGATGAVGQVMLDKLNTSDLPIGEVVPFASERSAGRELNGATVQALSRTSIEGFDLALFSAGGNISGEWAPQFAENGSVVVDNSSRWRQHPDVPLVVAEVNPEDLEDHRGIIANPNCSTMQLMVALNPIHAAAGIDRLNVSTYQSVSGTGVRALQELDTQTRADLSGGPIPTPHVYPHQIAFNVLGGAGSFAEGDDHTDEERKLMFETRKILGDNAIRIAATCVRVPVRYGHSESVSLETVENLAVEEARQLLSNAPGLVVIDDPAANSYPTPVDVTGRDEVFVGRIRRDPSHERGLQMWVVGDNLHKGAATNAVQIAQLLFRRGLIR